MPQFPHILTWKNSFPSPVYSVLSFSQATLSLLPEPTIRNEAEDWQLKVASADRGVRKEP